MSADAKAEDVVSAVLCGAAVDQQLLALPSGRHCGVQLRNSPQVGFVQTKRFVRKFGERDADFLIVADKALIYTCDRPHLHWLRQIHLRQKTTGQETGYVHV